LTDRYRVVVEGGNVFVVDETELRVCDIPLLERPDSVLLRGPIERRSIAEAIARLLNEESDRCTEDAQAFSPFLIRKAHA
jgi:hypothetical protein